MWRVFVLYSFVSMLVLSTACSSARMGYTDTHVQDSIAEIQTRNKAPRRINGEEAQRFIDSVRNEFMARAGLDSASYYNIPQGYVRVMHPDGTWYFRKQTEEESEEMEGVSNRVNDGREDFGPIVAFDLEGQRVGTAGYREKGKPYKINTEGLPPGTYMLDIPGEKRMHKIVVN